MKREHFRGVVWPRPPSGKVKEHRYVVVGVLVTEDPIVEFSGHEFLLDGKIWGMADLLGLVKQKQPAMKIGTANQVLMTLDRLVGEEDS